MRRKNRDLMVTAIIASLNIIWTLLPNRPIVIGVILTMPLVFFLPGYILTEALFSKRTLIASHHLVLSLALSMAIDIIGGLILNVLPIGLQTLSWAGLLGLLTIVLAILVAYLRRGKQVNGIKPERLRITARQILLFGLAIIVAILSMLYAALGVVQQPHPGFTQLWMLPTVQAGKSCTVRLGVRSFEKTSVAYRVTITINGTQVIPSSLVVLTPQQEWQQLLPIAPGPVNQMYVEANLYRLDKPQNVYRNVHVTLSNLPVSKDGKTRQCGIVQTSSAATLISKENGALQQFMGLRAFLLYAHDDTYNYPGIDGFDTIKA